MSSFPEGEGDEETRNQKECPEMPCFNTEGCKPAWLCSPPKSETKKYEIPAGVTIIPLSQQGKYRTADSSGPPESKTYEIPAGVTILPISQTGRCRTAEPVPTGQDSSCPAAKPQECPGFFSRLSSFFCGESQPPESSPPATDCPQSDSLPVPTECPEIPSCPEASEEMTCDCGCGGDPEPNPAQEFMDNKCGCSICQEQNGAKESLVRLPDPDCREIGVKAQELLETSCGCGKCQRSRPRVDENGNPLPVSGCCGVTCGECGCTRGQNSECAMCNFAVRMKQEGDFLEQRRLACIALGIREDVVEEKPCQRSLEVDEEPFKWFKGRPVYEGGMSLSRANRYLWAMGACDDGGFRNVAFEGQVLRIEEEEEECTCEEHLKKKRYRGGMTLEEAQEYLWIKNKLPPATTSEEN